MESQLSIRRPATLTALAACMALQLASFSANAQSPVVLGILVEYIEVEHTTATELLRAHTKSADASSMRAEVEKLIEAKKAGVFESSYLVTRSGQRAKIESILELIYPTEFDPPETPQELTGPIDPKVDLRTNVTATTFTTRNTGHTLEVDPILGSDGETIDLNIAPEIVVYGGEKEYGQGPARITQPIFHTMRVSTAVSMKSGQYALIGVQTPFPPLKSKDKSGLGHPDQAGGKRLLVFVRCTALTVPAPK
jgi:Flp pilus assembly secretin CpaC